MEVNIPDTSDPDHRYHGLEGEVTEVFEDDLGGLTGDPLDSYMITVEFDSEEYGSMTFRYEDLERGSEVDQ